jgi:hypothetical protein
MKLDDAYQRWGQENETLYINTRQKFRKVWWLIPTNKPCEYYTLPVLGRALQQANADKGDKVQAASVMVHVLNYAHQQEPDLNPAPTFTHTDIVNFEGMKPSKMVQAMESARGQSPDSCDVKVQSPGSKQTSAEGDARGQSPDSCDVKVQSPGIERPLVKVKPAAKAKREGVLARRAGTVPKSVVQLDADTLKPIKVWKSCNAAQNGLGIKNVQRAISRCGISGGYYWCRPGDEETFKPADKRSKNGGKAKPKKAAVKVTTNAPKTESILAEKRELLHKVFDSPERQQPETLAEACKNFQEAINEHVDQVLQHCSQDELIAELRRRSWKGILHITQTIEL